MKDEITQERQTVKALREILEGVQSGIRELESDADALTLVIDLFERRNPRRNPTSGESNPTTISSDENLQEIPNEAKQFKDTPWRRKTKLHSKNERKLDGKCVDCGKDRQGWTKNHCYDCAKKHAIYKAKSRGLTHWKSSGKYGRAGESLDPAQAEETESESESESKTLLGFKKKVDLSICWKCNRIYSGEGIDLKYHLDDHKTNYPQGECSRCVEKGETETIKEVRD